MSESELVAAIRLGCSDLAVLWRNHTGQVQDARTGRTHRFGLCVGSSDLIGIRRSDGRFVALEVKTATGRATQEQLDFAAIVRSLGGIGAVVRSVEEARKELEK